jgi:hypothetical protein
LLSSLWLRLLLVLFPLLRQEWGGVSGLLSFKYVKHKNKFKLVNRSK